MKKSLFDPMFTDDDIRKFFGIYVDKAEENILSMLIAAGEVFVKSAREDHAGNWRDQTGNLRSSIGYIVIRDGEEVANSGFPAVHGNYENSAIAKFTTKKGENVKFHAEGASGDGTEGSETGQRLAREIAMSYPTGLVLIGVAGMNYAAAVEAKGYDIITGAGDMAEKYLQDAIKSVFDKHG